jgi:Beta-propeller repeat/Abnormal spindle-like microcephaly-assoc'd, ASPM-SPD-2-Hydin
MSLRTLTCLLLGLGMTMPSMAQQSAPSQVAAQRAKFGQLPVTFEANLGQTDRQVNFISRGKGYAAFLTAGGMVLSLHPSQVGANPVSKSNAAANPRQSGATVNLRLVGAAKNPAAVGEDPQPGRVNYFIGNDTSQWHRNVPTYGRVRYKNVYPGIDLIYYGNHRQLEYDFAVSAGGDPSRIQLEIRGASKLQLDTEGNLILHVGQGELHFQSPVVYQEINGQRVPISGGYIVTDASHVAFQVANYDHNHPLVIDPVLVYSTYLGGSGSDVPSGIAVDSSGNVYLAGYTNSLDFPLATVGSLPAGNHVFVAKLDPTGSTLIYADYLGGNNQDYGYALALDSSNNVWVAGSTGSSNFPMVNAFQGTYPGSFNGFVSEISNNGASLLYSSYLGGNGSDQPASMTIDSAGEVVVAGNTTSTNFPMANAFQSSVLANQGSVFGNYGFVTKFNSSGSALVFSTYLAGNTNIGDSCGNGTCWPSPFSAVAGVAVDGSGNVYAGGTTNTYNFPTSNGAYQQTNTTQGDSEVGFVTKFSTTGSLGYSTYFYGTGGLLTTVDAIAVDGAGSAYVTGASYSDGTFPITSTAICDPGVYNIACSFAFVTKFDAGGDSLVYSTFLGPNNFASPEAIVLDSSEDAYVLASSTGNGFDLVNGIEPYSNGNDLLLVEIDPVAGSELFATFLGGNTDENPSSLAVDSNGNMYVAGSTDSMDFPATQGAFQTALGGGTDAFVMKIGSASSPAVSLSPYALQFSSQNVGSTSAAQSVLLRNMGSASLPISSITPSGDFAESDTCENSVPAASNCTLSVTFTPTAAGSRSGSIIIQDSAAGSPHLVSLSGTGAPLAPIAGLSPTTLSFPNTNVGASSTALPITLSNTGNGALTIGNIQTTGNYSQTNNCGSSLAASTSCTVNVVFAPTASGVRTGTLSVTDNATGSPQTASLTGTGIALAPAAVLSPTSLSFSSTPTGTSSTAQPVTLANNGNASLTISNIKATGDYSQTNNCGASLAASSNCTINVVFTPTATGARSGTVSVTDNATNSPQSATLTGNGVDFAVASSPTTFSLKAGASATYTLTVSAVGGSFASAVKLSCGSLPSKTACSFSTSSVTPGATSATSTLTISTTATTAEAEPLPRSRHAPVYAFWIQLQGFGLFGLVCAGSRKRSRRAAILAMFALLILGVLFMAGCAGGTGIGSVPGTGSGTYTVTVTGVSGSLQHSVPLTLTVQ